MNVDTLESISIYWLTNCPVTYVFVYECCVSAFPGCDTSTAVPQCYKTGLNPRSAEAVEEISLASNLVFVEVRISKFSNVHLNLMSEISNIVQIKAYSVLVRVESTEVEPSIGVAH